VGTPVGGRPAGRIESTSAPDHHIDYLPALSASRSRAARPTRTSRNPTLCVSGPPFPGMMTLARAAPPAMLAAFAGRRHRRL